MSKKSLLIPAILIVLALAIVAVVLVLALGGNGGNDVIKDDDPMAIRFAKAVLTCDQEEIRSCVHENMADDFCNRYGANEIRFTDCTATISAESALLRDGMEYYASTLNRDYDIQAAIETGCFYTVDFTAEYNDKEYSGSMNILVVTFDGRDYVISAELLSIEDAFYQDNYPAGDYYYDMFGED